MSESVAASGFGNGFQVVEHLRDLRCYIAFNQHHSFRDEWNLSRQVNSIANFNGLRISSNGLWGEICVDG